MRNLIAYTNPKSIVSESIKILRTNLQFSSVDNGFKTLMITSSIPGEGKSFITSNLAVAYAALGMKVLIVDCDMRRGTQHRYFGMSKYYGLSDLMIDPNVNYEKYIKNTKVEGVDIIVAGTTPPNPSELLSSEKFQKFLEDVKNMYDLVIFDVPPVTAVSDATIIATKVDKTVIIARVKVTPIDQLELTKKTLEGVGANIAGVVVNGIKISSKKYYVKYYN
ncbi:MAG: CpsD/CapB family tyrosine-protein kinase [Clostridia bacterium]|nr:CpsD/CapB family tyrosine-protein kinase [Clostridia bacterium]MDD4375354.1 CpsD/CapB family tyrosine-protein kinase [Clostridia bacterium]